MSKLSKHWLSHRKKDWARLEELLQQAQARVSGLSVKELRELGFLYRAAMNDLSRVRSAQDHRHLEPYLNELLIRCHGHLYTTPAARWQEILHFFTHQFPQTFRKHGLLIGLSFSVFLVAAILSMVAVYLNPSLETQFLPESTIAELDAGKLWMDGETGKASSSSFLMQNNIRVAFQSYVWGILFGVGTLYAMWMNGMHALGGPLQVCFNHDMGWKLLRFCSAHGVIELTTIFIAGGAGLLIGKSLVFPGAYSKWQALQANAKESLILIAGCVPMLFVAGLIEGLVSLSPSVPTWVRVLIAALSFVGLILYLGFSGRVSKKVTV